MLRTRSKPISQNALTRSARTAAIAVTTAAAAVLAGCAGGDGSLKVESGVATVRIAEAGQAMAQAPFLAAMAMDVFAEHDLAVESVGVFGNSSDPINAMSSGSADVASPGATSALDAVDAGAPLQTIAATTFGTQTVVLANDTVAAIEQSSGVTPDSSPEDKLRALRGLTIATPGAGSSNDLTIRAWLRDIGVDGDSDLSLVPSAPPAMISGMQNGLYDGVTRTIDPIAADAVQRGVGTIWLQQSELPEWSAQIGAMYIVTERFVKANPEVAQRFSDAMAESAAMMADPDRKAEVGHAVRDRYFAETDEAAFDLMWDTVTSAVVPGQLLTQEQYDRFVTLAEKTTSKDYGAIQYGEFFAVKPGTN